VTVLLDRGADINKHDLVRYYCPVAFMKRQCIVLQSMYSIRSRYVTSQEKLLIRLNIDIDFYSGGLDTSHVRCRAKSRTGDIVAAG
jgi:hypothetical protein